MDAERADAEGPRRERRACVGKPPIVRYDVGSDRAAAKLARNKACRRARLHNDLPERGEVVTTRREQRLDVCAVRDSRAGMGCVVAFDAHDFERSEGGAEPMSFILGLRRRDRESGQQFPQVRKGRGGFHGVSVCERGIGDADRFLAGEAQHDGRGPKDVGFEAGDRVFEVNHYDSVLAREAE